MCRHVKCCLNSPGYTDNLEKKLLRMFQKKSPVLRYWVYRLHNPTKFNFTLH